MIRERLIKKIEDVQRKILEGTESGEQKIQIKWTSKMYETGKESSEVGGEL